MIHRFLSLALAMVMCAPMSLSAVTFRAAADGSDLNDTGGLTPEIAKAYLQVIDDHIRTYGGFSQETTDEYGSDEKTPGFAGGFIRDWDQDGVPELYVEDMVEESPGYEYGLILPRNEIWTWKNGEAVRIFYTGMADPYAGDPSLADDFYWVSGNGRSWLDYSLNIHNGKTYITVTWEWLGNEFDGEESDSESDYYTVTGSWLVKLDKDPSLPDSSAVTVGLNGKELRELLATASDGGVGGFNDVAKDSPYAEAILWAVENNITKGTGAATFSPSAACSCNEILTFMWRVSDSPAASIQNPFPNMNASTEFGKAALWAYEKGMINKSYNGAAPCTRAQAMLYLYEMAGSPKAVGGDVWCIDVPRQESYADAVYWALSNGITKGTKIISADVIEFSPDIACSRGQIVTFLYRFLSSEPKLLPIDYVGMTVGDVARLWGNDYLLERNWLAGAGKPFGYLDQRVPLLFYFMDPELTNVAHEDDEIFLVEFYCGEQTVFEEIAPGLPAQVTYDQLVGMGYEGELVIVNEEFYEPLFGETASFSVDYSDQITLEFYWYDNADPHTTPAEIVGIFAN